MKVERVSYDIITPSAARAIFEAILWKPAIRWHIRTIEVLTPIRWMSLRRNEVGNKIPVNSVRGAMRTAVESLAYISKMTGSSAPAGFYAMSVIACMPIWKCG